MSGRGNRKRSEKFRENLRGMGLRKDKRATSSSSPLSQSQQHVPPWQTGRNRFLSWWSSAPQPGSPPPRCRERQARSNTPAQHPGEARERDHLTQHPTVLLCVTSPHPGYAPTSTERCAGTVPEARLGSWPHSRGFQPKVCWMGPHSSSA